MSKAIFQIGLHAYWKPLFYHNCKTRKILSISFYRFLFGDCRSSFRNWRPVVIAWIGWQENQRRFTWVKSVPHLTTYLSTQNSISTSNCACSKGDSTNLLQKAHVKRYLNHSRPVACNFLPNVISFMSLSVAYIHFYTFNKTRKSYLKSSEAHFWSNRCCDSNWLIVHAKQGK